MITRSCRLLSGVVILATALPLVGATPAATFNVRDYGATGKKADDARGAIQRAIDECARNGGGTVYLPPGEYTSGTIILRSHVRLYIDSGATLYASLDSRAFEKGALLYAEDAKNITLEGRGTIDGQAQYEWRTDELDDAYIRDNSLLMKGLGLPQRRSFPKGFPTEAHPKLVLLLRCQDVRIAGLSFVRSRSWTIHPYACERLVIDGVYIYSSLKEAVWADGIDPDGCKDVRIANSTIETGDDAIVFYSMNFYGPALPCENITVTNCRLSSASSALKFCDGNMNCIRRVTVNNTVITNSNRGLAFMVFDGGYVSDVVISNVTIDCTRHDWFWWGDGDPLHFNIRHRSEVHPQASKEKEPPAGSIRNIIIRDVIARGMGTSLINGHPDSWLDGITLQNIKLRLASDPQAHYQKGTQGLKIRWAQNLKLEGVEVVWDDAEPRKWDTALEAEDVWGLELDGFSGRPARDEAGQAAVVLRAAEDVTIRHSRAGQGTPVFLRVGPGSRRIRLYGNDLERAREAYVLDSGVSPAEVSADNSRMPATK